MNSKDSNRSLEFPKIQLSDMLQTSAIAAQLHKRLTSEQIEEIRQMFFANDNTLSYSCFRDILGEFNIMLSDSQYLTLFLRLNLDKDNLINWDEFVTYLIFCFQEDDPYSQKESLILPIPEEPLIKESRHKTPIIGMTILRSIVDHGDEKQFGYYITASKDGAVNFLSPDLEVTKKGLSKSHYLKYTPTWVLHVTALSDVRIVCISSTERELRFYDVTATNFHLRIIIRSVPYAISAITYCQSKFDDVNSKLLMGDYGGNLRIIEFSPKLRGPFKSTANSNLIELSWNQLLKGKLSEMHVTEYFKVFPTNISQVSYSYKLDTIYIAAATYSKYLDKSGLIAIDSRGTKNLFHIPQGVSTFFLDEENSVLATGGPDTFLRFWEPYVSSKASTILEGHRSGIVFIFIQSNEKLCYSIDITKTIKVWHLIDHIVLQTFSDLRIVLANETQFCYMYNRFAHELLIGGRKLITIKCCPKIELDITDGNTHAGSVSVVLYNKLFENIVTCGLDSYIIVWDVWTGKRQIIMKKCHTMNSMGQNIDVEITAGAFDPSYQYLITGARDGSLKIWNYNNAFCTRNLQIEARCEVTAIFWIPDRILVVGWNRHVTQFADIKGLEYTDGKNWMNLHEGDITAAACKSGGILVTGSYVGELIFWKSETGQPYRKHEVKYPKKYCNMYSDQQIQKKSESVSRISVKEAVNIRLMGRTDTVLHNIDGKSTINVKRVKVNKLRRMDSRGVAMPKVDYHYDESHESHALKVKLNLCIEAIVILNKRPVSKDHGNVFVALDNGWIQVYSQHEAGGYITEFNASHKSGDCVNTMITDKSNKYLITGTSLGYIKIWLLQNYCIPEAEHKRICKPLLRLQFFFLTHDRINGRAKRLAKNNLPLLLSSHKAHIRTITSICYLDIPQIVITGSHDCSVRMWTIGGCYLGTIGGLVPIQQLIRNELVKEKQYKNRIPPDIHKVASATTLKVLSGIYTDNLSYQIQLQKEIDENDKDDNNNNESDDNNLLFNQILNVPYNMYDKKHNSNKCNHSQKLKEPLLGKHFPIKETIDTNKNGESLVLDKSLPYIPVYSHLKLNQTKIVENTSITDESIKKIKKLQFTQYYKP